MDAVLTTVYTVYCYCSFLFSWVIGSSRPLRRSVDKVGTENGWMESTVQAQICGSDKRPFFLSNPRSQWPLSFWLQKVHPSGFYGPDPLKAPLEVPPHLPPRKAWHGHVWSRLDVYLLIKPGQMLQNWQHIVTQNRLQNQLSKAKQTDFSSTTWIDF